jgi:hypothetical protein
MCQGDSWTSKRCTALLERSRHYPRPSMRYIESVELCTSERVTDIWHPDLVSIVVESTEGRGVSCDW